MPEDLNNLDDSESETNKIPMENHMQLGTKRSPSLWFPRSSMDLSMVHNFMKSRMVTQMYTAGKI